MLIVSVLVQVPEAVSIETTPTNGVNNIRVTVHPTDIGFIIGRDGLTGQLLWPPLTGTRLRYFWSLHNRVN